MAFSLVVLLSFPSCADKEAGPESNIYLLYRCPPSTGLFLDIHDTGVELPPVLLLLSPPGVFFFLSTSDNTKEGERALGMLPEYAWGFPNTL